MMGIKGDCRRLNAEGSGGCWISLACAIATSFAGLGTVAQAQTEPDASAGSPLAEQIFEQLLDVPSIYEVGVRGTQAFSDRDTDWPVVTQASTSLFSPTLPSLWWNRDQVYDRWGGYRLIRGWAAFHSMAGDASIIDIQLDPQYWNRLDYYPQYAILNQLGTTAMSYGYQLRLYSSISLVGMYTCDFSNIPNLESSPNLEVPVPELDNVQCFGAVSPFVQFEPPLSTEDLFVPP